MLSLRFFPPSIFCYSCPSVNIIICLDFNVCNSTTFTADALYFRPMLEVLLHLLLGASILCRLLLVENNLRYKFPMKKFVSILSPPPLSPSPALPLSPPFPSVPPGRASLTCIIPFLQGWFDNWERWRNN